MTVPCPMHGALAAHIAHGRLGICVASLLAVAKEPRCPSERPDSPADRSATPEAARNWTLGR